MKTYRYSVCILYFCCIHFSSPDHIRYQSSNERFEGKVVSLVNQQRDKYGLSPLVSKMGLTQAARYHALDMGIHNYFSHDSKRKVRGQWISKLSFYERVNQFYDQRASLGENIAAGYKTPEAVVEGWMNSKGHRENILNPNWTSIGVGYMHMDQSEYQHYWVQEFASH